ncbi:MAG: HYR domain-containing protein [Saprospiraceae bacterium]|nr:HYR domain-containing protein [Saprospiraceae bacterium]
MRKFFTLRKDQNKGKSFILGLLLLLVMLIGASVPAYAQPGCTPIVGSFDNTGGTLDIELQSPGLVACTDYDQVQVSGSPGTATLGGTLNVTQYGGAWLNSGMAPISFTILTATGVSGTFVTTNYPTVAGAYWTITYNANNVVITMDGCASDNVDPVFTLCPGNDLIYSDPANQCSAPYLLPVLTATDNCDVSPTITVTVNGNPATVGNYVTLPVGLNTIVYTAVDDLGNDVTCTYTVTVEDDDDPIINCPAVINVTSSGGADVNPGDCGATAAWSTITASDNCPGVSVQATNNSYTPITVPPGFDWINQFFPVGTTPVYYRAIDAAGNTATCTFNVVVTDDEPPLVSSCPTPAASYNNDAGFCYSSQTFTVGVTDNCPSNIEVRFYDDVLLTNLIGTDISAPYDLTYNFPVGTTNVYVVVDDGYTEVTTCSFSVTVLDVETPGITCPTPLASYDTDAGECNATLSFAATAIDNCPASLVYTYTVAGNPITFPYDFLPGTTTVTATVTDGTNTSLPCSFDVVVVDNQDPVFSNCPISDIDVLSGPDCYYTVVGTEFDWAFTDNCGATATNDFNSLATLNGAQLPKGANIIIWTAVDAATNSATCTFTVNVNNNVARVDAGTDQTVCYSATVGVPISAIVYGEDNVPGGTGVWSGGAGTFGSATSNTTTYTPDVSEIGTTVSLTFTADDPDGTGPCTGGQTDAVDITVKHQPLLQMTLNGVTVTDNNDGTTDEGSFTVCNEPNNISFLAGAFQNLGAGTGTTVRVYQTRTLTNVSFPYCNNCQGLLATLAASGLSSTASLVNPTLPGTLVITWQIWDDTDNNSIMDPTECSGDIVQYTITIAPDPFADNATPFTCSDVAINVDLQAQITNSVISNFTWTVAPNANVTGQADGSGDFINQTLTNLTGSPEDVVYTVTPTSDPEGCVGGTFTVTVTVNPEPVADNATPTTCSDVALNVDLQGQVSNGVSSNFTWTVVDNTNVTGESDGSGDNITQTITNLTGTAQTVVYTVTPTSDPEGCVGSTFTVTVTVNPEPVADDATPTTCSDVALNVDLQGQVTNLVSSNFTWTVVDNPNVTGESAGSGDVITDIITNLTGTAQTVVYTVTPTSDPEGCVGSTFTVTVTVNPEPVATNGTALTCSDVALNVDLQLQVTNLISSDFTWTVVDNPNVTGESAGSGDYITQTINNVSATAQTVVYTVTPTSVPEGCVGSTFTITVTVNPEPVIASYTAGAVCSDGATGHTFNNDPSPAATTFNITDINSNGLVASAGSPATGTGFSANVIANDAWTNLTPNTVNVIYTVVPVSAALCLGDPFTVTVPIYPEPDPIAGLTVGNPIIVPICSSVAFDWDPNTNILNIPGNTQWRRVQLNDPAGTTGEPITSPLLPGFTNSNHITGTIFNFSTSEVDVNYRFENVRSSDHLCVGDNFWVTLRVSPEVSGNILPGGDLTLCTGETRVVEAVPALGIAPFTYTWAIVDTDGTGSSLSSLTAQSPTLTAGNTPGNFNLTLYFTDSQGCLSPVYSLTFTVNPNPNAYPATLQECEDPAGTSQAPFTLTDADATVLGGQTGMTVTYHNSASDAAGDIGALSSPYTSIPGQVWARVENNTTGCYAVSIVTLDVNLAPVLSVTGTNVTCNGANNGTATVVVTNMPSVTPVTYDWSNDGADLVDDDLATITGLAPGTYTVTVTSADGCTAVGSILITEPQILYGSAPSPVLVCSGTSALVYITATGGTPGYQYSLNGVGGPWQLDNWFTLPVGSYANIKVKDANGCIASVNTVQVIPDNVPPTLGACPGNIAVDTDTDECNQDASWNSPSVQDNCQINTYVLTFTNGTPVPAFLPANEILTSTLSLPVTKNFALGQTIVTYTAIDAAGNTSICTFTVTVTENDPPSFEDPDDVILTTLAGSSCPAAATVSIEPGVIASGSTYTVAGITQTAPHLEAVYSATTAGYTDGGYADACTAAPVLTLVSKTFVTDPCSSTWTLVWRVTDNYNNFTEQTQVFTIQDNTNPTASNPLPINVQCYSSIPAADVAVVTDEADNCDPAPVVTLLTDIPAAPTCNGGPITVTRTYRITDVCNNYIDVVQTINVSDVTDPTASNPADINVQCYSSIPAADVAVVTDEADNCDPAPVVTLLTDIPAAPTCNGGPITVTRTYRITDCSNNYIDVVQTINVSDVTDPTASNPADINVQCYSSIPAADVAVVTDEADNCDPAPVVTLLTDIPAAPTCNGGPITVTRTYRITDCSNNYIDVVQTINVSDVTDPTASNPADINVQCYSSIPAADVAVVTDEADNCDPAPVVTLLADIPAAPTQWRTNYRNTYI